jgi:hypothetical protein
MYRESRLTVRTQVQAEVRRLNLFFPARTSLNIVLKSSPIQASPQVVTYIEPPSRGQGRNQRTTLPEQRAEPTAPTQGFKKKSPVTQWISRALIGIFIFHPS